MTQRSFVPNGTCHIQMSRCPSAEALGYCQKKGSGFGGDKSDECYQQSFDDSPALLCGVGVGCATKGLPEANA